MALTKHIMGVQRLVVVLLIISVTNIAAASLAQLLEKQPLYNNRNHRGRSDIDIGLEIHKMHVRQGIGSSSAKKDDTGETDHGSADFLKSIPGLFDDIGTGATIRQEMERDRPADGVELELQLALQLQELSSSAAPGLPDLEDQLISGQQIQENLGHVQAVFDHPNDAISATEDLSRQLHLLGESLPKDSDMTEESSASGDIVSGDGWLDSIPSLETTKNTNILDLGDRLFGVEVSGSGDFSGSSGSTDRSVYEDIVFTSLPLYDRNKNVLSTVQPRDQQNLEILDTFMSSTEITKVQGKTTDVDLSVHERLELELDGLSLAVDNIVSVDADQVDNDASLESAEEFWPALSTVKSPAASPDSIVGGLRGKYVMPTPNSSVDLEEAGRKCLDDQFSCRSGSQCLRIEDVCDSVKDCEDGSDEDPSLCVSTRKCGSKYFKCGSSAQCISQSNICDGIYHCANGEDERHCSTCKDRNGEVLFLTVEDFCDGVKDCADGSDENKQRCELPCSPGYRKCQDSLQCVKEELFCNGISNCHDLSDEKDCGRTDSDCQVFGMFACDGLCHPMAALCDSTYDCRSGIDEDGCGYGDP